MYLRKLTSSHESRFAYHFGFQYCLDRNRETDASVHNDPEMSCCHPSRPQLKMHNDARAAENQELHWHRWARDGDQVTHDHILINYPTIYRPIHVHTADGAREMPANAVCVFLFFGCCWFSCVSLCVCVWLRERERERGRDRQADRQTDKQRERKREKRHTHRDSKICNTKVNTRRSKNWSTSLSTKTISKK